MPVYLVQGSTRVLNYIKIEEGKVGSTEPIDPYMNHYIQYSEVFASIQVINRVVLVSFINIR